MLRFRLRQVHVPSLERYFLPLPKLTDVQLEVLSSHLELRGFRVWKVGGSTRLVALRGTQRISIDGRLGLASSSTDLLDAVAPAVPGIIEAARTGALKTGQDVAGLYFSVKGSGKAKELQLFPRLEALGTWTCLRRDGLSGLAPDEEAVLKHLLKGASSASRITCVTAKPRRGSKRIQAGRNLYYESSILVSEFLSSLRTIETGTSDSASYLPRDSVLAVPSIRLDTRMLPDELGEWCWLGG